MLESRLVSIQLVVIIHRLSFVHYLPYFPFFSFLLYLRCFSSGDTVKALVLGTTSVFIWSKLLTVTMVETCPGLLAILPVGEVLVR